MALTVALQAILKSDFLKEKLLEAASGYVDAALEVSELDFGLLRTYPDVEARFCGLSVTCPPPRPDASVCDTLLRADTVILRLNLPALSAGRIDVRRAHLNGVRLYARRYDSLSVNWDVLALPENPEDRADTVRAEFPRVNVREFSLGPDCLLVFDDLPSSVSVRLNPGRVRLSGRIGPGRRAPRVSGISLSVDSLKAGLVSGTDSLDYTLAGLRVEQTGLGSFSLAAESLADLASADFGSMAVPFNLDGELAYAFLPEGLGVSASGLSVYLACMPFLLDGSVLLGDGYADMDASLSLVECRWRMCCTTMPPGSTLMRRLSVRMPCCLRISPRMGVSATAACRNSAPACVFRSPVRSICLTVPSSTSRPMSTWSSPQGVC